MGALSKGCRSCKRRKVKFDKTHPQCIRCRNAGIECIGFAPAVSYAQSHQFTTITKSSHAAFHSSTIFQSRPLNEALFLANTTLCRQSTFLRDPIWKMVPCKDDPISNNTMFWDNLTVYNSRPKLAQ